MLSATMSAPFRTPVFREDSDADDEYERDGLMSPTLPTEFSGSPTESDDLSTEQTPTFAHHLRDGSSPRGKVMDWSADQSADFIAELGLEQYADKFVEEYITGDALVALVHSDLKDMGINSIGHRLIILKGVYDLKMKQNVIMEPEHYVPLSADPGAQEAAPTHEDITRIINIIKDRDDELRSLRDDLVKISEENRKLREEILPLVKAAKDRSQPLPQPEENDIKPSGLSRKFSNKRIFLSNTGNGLKNNPSPTIQESGLDPSAAAMAASTHLTASMRDGPIGSPNQPQLSPTSPGPYRDAPGSSQLTSRPFPRQGDSDYPHLTLQTSSTTLPSIATPPTSTPQATVTTPSSAHPSSGGSNNVEIFKSFRVSIDDPCYKVLPVALKKYNISADWRQYALYIVYGDQERCLGLNEKPLILFKQLDKEGRKPMFMLRKHAAPAEGHVNIVQQPVQQQNAGALPGGVL